jgi:hypothetical protein
VLDEELKSEIFGKKQTLSTSSSSTGDMLHGGGLPLFPSNTPTLKDKLTSTTTTTACATGDCFDEVTDSAVT